MRLVDFWIYNVVFVGGGVVGGSFCVGVGFNGGHGLILVEVAGIEPAGGVG